MNSLQYEISLQQDGLTIGMIIIETRKRRKKGNQNPLWMYFMYVSSILKYLDPVIPEAFTPPR